MCITKCSNMENVLIMVMIGCTIALICYIMCCMECCSELDIKSADITEKKAPRSEPVIQKNLSLMHPDQLNPIL
jgi:hypothetical protein